MKCVILSVLTLAFVGILGCAMANKAFSEERQLTVTCKNHNLDNNDNFSADGRFLCFDTRGEVGGGIDNSLSIEKVEVATGKETVIYKPANAITGPGAAPGVGAVSYSPVEDKVLFIHGPLVEDVPVRGSYAKTNRTGAEVAADGSGLRTWVDARDVATNRDTLPGAHRGGTHRHEYTLDGKRIGFTYDDFLMKQYARTIGYMEKNPKAPLGASHYFALLVPTVPAGTSKPGEIELASSDSWVGRHGLMRAFIGKVRKEDGVNYEESLFVVDIPDSVAITTADSGGPNRFPTPPKGVKIRRLTQTNAGGVVRGAPEGDRIAYYANAPDGTRQVFVIASDGSDRDPDPAKCPIQLTRLPKGSSSGIRWRSDGASVFSVSNNGIVETWALPGEKFGKSRFLTPEGDKPVRNDLVLSPDGKQLAFSKEIPTRDGQGKVVKTFDGKDLVQIFIVDVQEW